jgi:hypothetical protein
MTEQEKEKLLLEIKGYLEKLNEPVSFHDSRKKIDVLIEELSRFNTNINGQSVSDLNTKLDTLIRKLP